MAGAQAAYERFHHDCELYTEAMSSVYPRQPAVTRSHPALPYQGKPALHPTITVRRVRDADLSPEEFRERCVALARGECPSAVRLDGLDTYCEVGAGHDGMHRAGAVTWVEMDSLGW